MAAIAKVRCALTGTNMGMSPWMHSESAEVSKNWADPVVILTRFAQDESKTWATIHWLTNYQACGFHFMKKKHEKRTLTSYMPDSIMLTHLQPNDTPPVKMVTSLHCVPTE